MEKIDCKKLAHDLQEEYKAEVEDLERKSGMKPNLVVIMVGDNPASDKYVRNKERACEKVGIETKTLRLDKETSQDWIIDLIHALNSDRRVNGILVQLPLPSMLDADRICNEISPEKDVDGFTRENVAKLWLGNTNRLNPCTPQGVITILEASGFEFPGKRATVLGRSKIVGLPMAKLLLDKNCTVQVCHSKSDIAKACSDTDLIVSAIGKPRYLNASLTGTHDRPLTIIDVGINADPETGKICGDVDLESFSNHTGFITPVPGGVGPMTVTMLLKNTIKAFREQNSL